MLGLQIGLVGQRRATLTPPSDQWIMETGSWNDAGVWEDDFPWPFVIMGNQWNDDGSWIDPAKWGAA